MINLFQDIWNVLTSFALVDYILYISVVTLIILIVSLIYVIKNEKNETQRELEVEEVKKEDYIDVNQDEELDLLNIVNNIDENPKPLIDMTAYEEEQEQKAIISYDELIQMESPKTIHVTDEKLVDDVISVKQIQVCPMELPKKTNEFAGGLKLTQKEPKFEIASEAINGEEKKVKLFSYEKEEAFLRALKELNELLND